MPLPPLTPLIQGVDHSDERLNFHRRVESALQKLLDEWGEDRYFTTSNNGGMHFLRKHTAS